MDTDTGSTALSPNIKIFLICAFLIVATLGVYLQVGGHEFVNFDDDEYVFKNYQVKQGLTIDGFKWAFGFNESSYWHPLTWLSHMADCEIFGLDPGKHHLMNLFFHIVNILLLFLVLIKLTGATVRSAIVAGLFALHPVNVDTVAWVAERKNIISTTFWLICMLAYFYYTKKPSIYRYFMAFTVFLAGLLAKPMLVTLPFVFLLLDYWPLGRIEILYETQGKKKRDTAKKTLSLKGEPVFSLIKEKIPMIALSLVIILISSRSIHNLGANVGTDLAPMNIRIANAIVSYIVYAWKMIWPSNLTFYYPYPEYVPFPQIFVSVILLIAAIAFAIRSLRRFPYILVGLLWFLGSLVPVSGIIQGGLWPAIAERWAYVPYIGLYIILAWGITDLTSRLPYRTVLLSSAASILFIIIIGLSWIQAGYWKNDYTLCDHALKVNMNNFVAHNNMGMVYRAEGNAEKAIYHYTQAIRINPGNPNAHSNLANALTDQQKFEDAIKYYKEAIGLKPDYAEAHMNLGSALERLGRNEEASAHYKKALAMNPHMEITEENLGNICLTQGKPDEAIAHYNEALKTNPYSAQTFYNLGNAYAKKGDMDMAIRQYNNSLQIDPLYVDSLNNLGNALATLGRYDEAVIQYKKALQINPGSVNAKKNIIAVNEMKKNTSQPSARRQGF